MTESEIKCEVGESTHLPESLTEKSSSCQEVKQSEIRNNDKSVLTETCGKSEENHSTEDKTAHELVADAEFKMPSATVGQPKHSVSEKTVSEPVDKEEFKIPSIAIPLPKLVKEGNAVANSQTVEKNPQKPSGVNNQVKTAAKKSAFSPAEQLKQRNVVLAYLEPPWSGLCQKKYSLEVLKGGKIIDDIPLTERPFHVFGRWVTCHFVLEHPTLSRHHAVLQYCARPDELHPAGWYLYDLESTHGTIVNKIKVRARSFTRVRVGHVIKFGGSTRLYVLQVYKIFIIS